MSDLIWKDDVWTSEVGKLRADLAAAQRELAAWEQATHEGIDGKWLAEDIWPRVAELLAQEGVK